ncbi:MAG: radical SAM protein [Thermoplasmata archaeon]|nr:MAG: radical SAM protein [Thermoplasmata archaeon]
MIRVAVGSAKVLGLSRIKMDILPTTAHLMTPGRCVHDCKFCTQAKSSHADQKLLSRISWPEYEEEVVFSALRDKQDRFQRVCLQVVHSDVHDDFLEYVRKIRTVCDLPISVDIKADDIKIVRNTIEAGADVVGLPIDAANSQIFKRIKEGSFSSQMELIKQAADEFDGKISTHLIIGLGESEKDTVDLISELHRYDVTLGLFAFTPIKGTLLEDMNPPRLKQYRRIQLLRFLIYHNFDPDIIYDDHGNITGLDMDYKELMNVVEPSAFQTTGCPGCNRPFYNERPGETLYNYPYGPSKDEFQRALQKAISGLEGYIG